MKDIKTRPGERTPRILSDAARAPKELAKKSLLKARQKTQETAQRSEPQSESPEQYAENRIEATAEQAAHHTGREVSERGKQLARKARDARREYKEHKGNNGNTGQPHTGHTGTAPHSSESNAYRAGRERAANGARNTARRTAGRNARQAAATTHRAASGTSRTVRTSTKGAVKTAQKTVKTAEKAVKTTQKTVKVAAKTTQKTAQAAARAAQAAARAAQAAAKAAAAAAKVAAKAIAALVKAITAAVKALIAAIAAGGWVAVVIIVVAALIIALLAVFGVFSANEAPDGSKPMTEAIESINAEFSAVMDAKIAELNAQNGADVVEIIYEGDMESANSPVPNWADVVGIYAAKVGMDEENPADVTVVTPENIGQLSGIFYDMNSVSYRAEVEPEETTRIDEYGAVVYDEEGQPIVDTITTLYIYIDVSSMDYRDGAALYHLSATQMEMLDELMLPEYYPLFAELLGDTVGDGGEYGFGLNINPDLPASELGAQIVEAAKRYIGRSYSSMDCSKLARTAYNDCGLTSMNGLSSVYMAKKCEEMGVLFTDPSQLQAGDLIFFSRYDPGKGPEYCGDAGRCGTGKCKRWLHIHHVAIYINDEFLIDSTGGNNSVQIRKHWGMDTAKWKWVCFGRPTN